MPNRICIHIDTNELLEFQSGPQIIDGVEVLGTLTENAIAAGYSADEVIESYTDDDLDAVLATYESADDIIEREAKEARTLAINQAKKTIEDKYKDKKKSDISDADAIEWAKLSMSNELGLEV